MSTPGLFFPADSDGSDDDFDLGSGVGNDNGSGNTRDNLPSAGPSSASATRTASPAPPPPRVKEALFMASDDEDDGIMALDEAVAGPSSSARSRAPASSAPSSSLAKRRAPPSSPSNVPTGFQRGYLGEFVCEGWSLSKGKGYCSPGSKLVFERPKAKAATAVDSSAKGGPTRIVNGKVVSGTKAPIGGKQATISSMFSKKASPAVRSSRGLG